MLVRYRLIRNGVPINEQLKEYDGPELANKKQIEDDQFIGMDPGEMAADGLPADWIEATIL